MDFFALQNLRNAEVTVEATLPRPHHTARRPCRISSCSHPAWTPWYNVGGAVVHRADDAAISSHVGNELDITVRLPLGPVGLEVGYGRFFGGTYVRDANFAADTADFFYLQTMVGF